MSNLHENGDAEKNPTLFPFSHLREIAAEVGFLTLSLTEFSVRSM